MQNSSQTLGILGEELAYHFLLQKGYRVLLKNYECNSGEIDLIAKENGFLVFIEVKTRSSDERGLPVEAVTYHKRTQLVRAAQFYMSRYGIHDVPCRFDVVSVLMPQGQEPVLEVIQDAFYAGG